jgi:hypothetical protein
LWARGCITAFKLDFLRITFQAFQFEKPQNKLRYKCRGDTEHEERGIKRVRGEGWSYKSRG